MQERIDAAARARELYAALDALPEGERAVFELTALDELTPRQAAAALGIRPVTAPCAAAPGAGGVAAPSCTAT